MGGDLDHRRMCARERDTINEGDRYNYHSRDIVHSSVYG